MRHFIDGNGAIHGFGDNQLFLVTEDMREMTATEFKQFTTPKQRETDVWDEVLEQWVDGRTAEQIVADDTASLPALSAKDFRHMLDRAGLRTQVEGLIEAIEDPVMKSALKTEYEYAQFFERTNPAVIFMMQLLGLSDDQVNTEWKTPILLTLTIPDL